MDKLTVMGIIDRPCGHSLGVDCACVKQVGFVTTTTAAASFVWNGPLRLREGGGYEPAPLHMGGQITKEK